MSTRALSRVEKQIPVFQFLKDTNPSSGQLASELDTFGKERKKPSQNHHQDLKNKHLPSITVFAALNIWRINS